RCAGQLARQLRQRRVVAGKARQVEEVEQPVGALPGVRLAARPAARRGGAAAAAAAATATGGGEPKRDQRRGQGGTCGGHGRAACHAGDEKKSPPVRILLFA